MGERDLAYQMISVGDDLKYFHRGQIVFFLRLKCYGGGWWLGITHADGFEFIFNHPIKFSQGLDRLHPPKPSPVPPPEDF